MATKQEIQIFDTLLDRGLDANKAKEIVIRGRNENTLETISNNLGIRVEEPKQPEVMRDIQAGKKLELATPREQALSFAPVEQEDIEEVAIMQPQTKKEMESEEGIKGFVSETGEALKERGKNIGEIFTRQGERPRGEDIKKVTKEKGLGAGFAESMKQSALDFGTALQTVGQVVASGGDIAWEGVENVIQEVTPEKAEEFIEGTVAKIGDSKTVQSIAESYGEFRENNPETARNIEAVVNIGQIIPVTKGGQILKKPISETSKKAVRETAEKQLKNQGRAILNLPTKTKPTETLQLSKFFADKVKVTDDFDKLVTQFDDVAKKSIDDVNKSLAKSTTLHKPVGAREVLQNMVDNSKDIMWSATKTRELKSLLKKWQNEGLTLSELNKVKRSINDYAKGWTMSGKEGGTLKASAARDKYREVMKYIENTAKKENLGDIRKLNDDWIKASEIADNLTKQATKVGKRQGVQSLQQKSIIKSLGNRIRSFREDIGIADSRVTEGFDELSLEKVIKSIKKTAGKTEAQTIQSKIKGLVK